MGYVQHARSVGSPAQCLGDYLCWTRMQAEAGQELSRIVQRKEAERRAGGGLFFWGVGNAPATSIPSLSKRAIPIPVIFSVMKSAPKLADAHPSAVVVWDAYIDSWGMERQLPDHALVLSRRDSPGGAKKVHYALVCHSPEPLTVRRGDAFNHRAFCNASERGAPVGASQVTALVRHCGSTGQGADYEINMQAALTGSYWVRLTRPIQITSALENLPMDPCGWTNAVTALRSRQEKEGRQRVGTLL